MFGLSLQEVSQILNISKGAVKGLLYRAHMNLDSFFQDHCSILDVENPCRCEAWIEFYSRRQTLQDKVQIVKTLNYKKSGYVFNKYTFNKIKYLYKNMPEKRPSDDWYQKIVDSLKN
jgi:RNA polymerase sigma-70 factor (ECF subfamily)